MKILAFETSCDDTSIALFENDVLVAMDTASQIKIHEQTGGVVPEIAAREHANNIFKVLDNVLKNGKDFFVIPAEAGISSKEKHIENNKVTNNLKSNISKDISKSSCELIDSGSSPEGQLLRSINYIAVTMTPGLMPSLLTGITVARTISISLNIPLVEINHIESHIFSNYIERKEKDITYPLVCLTVSGGHNEIYYMKDMFDFNKVGGTQDDSAGEAFDKVAKMMGLGYPGGPIISELAEGYRQNISTNLFPRSWLQKDELNFSFSGVKSSVKREVDKRIEKKGELTLEDKQEIAFEFQEAVTEVLATKLVTASEKFGVKTVMLAGGVSANDRLKEYIEKLIIGKNIKFIYPIKKVYSMDNAAMVGINAYYKIIKNIL
ncbi:MAG: tRNA (adenosine(37)-N6)-threonylcarbamoyltransferase complex transferase subunit TsaD [Candidatus Gracilibacteria bacterium]